MPATSKQAKSRPPVNHKVDPSIIPERVLRYTYDVHQDKWTHTQSEVSLENKTFEEGSMRAAFFMLDKTLPEGQQKWVAKMSKDPKETKTTYFLDAEMQALAKLFAEEYNKREPPKKVNFLEAAVIKCLEREGTPVLSIEPWMPGNFQKYSNNWGYVSYDERNTPQAFSHFTYCHSSGKLLICDIQGVGDNFTDPQIHSRDGKGFGKGNLGHKGMTQFFKTHHCNSICKFLGLPLVNPKDDDRGTTAVINASMERLSMKGGQEPKQEASSKEGESPRKGQPRGPPGDPLDLDLLNLTQQQLDIIRSGFQKAADGKTRIDPSGMVKGCAVLGYDLPVATAKELVKRLDVMDEGGIDFRQFIWWWCGIEED